jgi:hypothetical protein
MLEIDEQIPVLAFGHPIPHLKSSYFSLPWNKKMHLHASSDQHPLQQQHHPHHNHVPEPSKLIK